MFKILGVAFGLLGVAVALWAPASGVVHKPVEGIAVFATLYVLAQGVERLVEWANDLASLSAKSPQAEKKDSLRALATANSTLNGNPSTVDFDDAEQKVVESKDKLEGARKDVTFFAHGLSILLAAAAVKLLNYGIFLHLGAEGVDRSIDALFTALAAAGGSKGLHELIGRLQKGKERDEENA